MIRSCSDTIQKLTGSREIRIQTEGDEGTHDILDSERWVVDCQKLRPQG